MGILSGKVALVMGASRSGNMGQAIARRFIDEGATLIVSGRGIDGLKTFAQETGAVSRPCDVTKRSQVFDMVDRIVKSQGRLDIAVNAAAIGYPGVFEDVSEEQLDRTLAVIFKGGFFFMQAAVGAMKRSGGGSIINVTSAVATIMFENHADYAGAKAGVEHVTRYVANEFGRYGIRANNIAPGLTVSPMTDGFLAPGVPEAFMKEMPLGRLNTVEDIANTALFVASDQCFMTGQTFHVTGGLTLRRNPTSAEIGASVEKAAQ